MGKSYSYGELNLSHEMMRTNHAGHVFNSKLSSRQATFGDFGASEYAGITSLDIEPDNLNNPDAVNNFNTKITYDIPLFTGDRRKREKKKVEKADAQKTNSGEGQKQKEMEPERRLERGKQR